MNNAKFKSFLDEYKYSLRAFATLIGPSFISKSTVGRLTMPDNGNLSSEYVNNLMPLLLESSAGILRQIGKSDSEISEILFEIYEKEYQPMITKRQKLEYEILDFFGLQRDPFALENDPKNASQVFTNKELDRIARRIEDAINFQGFLGIIGNIGSGKTSLKTRIADKFRKQNNVHLIFPKFVETEKLNAGSIVHYLLHYFGLKAKHRLALAQIQLETHLEHLNEQGITVAMILDNGERLNDSAITSLKNFYELGTGGYERYLGLILFGQKKLETKIAEAQFREIAERLELIEMPTMSKYAGEYIAHRLELAGGDINALFDKDAIERIASEATTPLTIGNLANKGLIEAYKKGSNTVLARYIAKDTDPKVKKIK
jgi:type II secretory pathway predicted ATPase ExeA